MDFRTRWQFARALSSKGMAGSSGLIMGIVIAVIVVVAVAIPVTQSVLYTQTCFNQTNVSICTPKASGTTSVVLNLLPLFLGLAALVTVAALFG